MKSIETKNELNFTPGPWRITKAGRDDNLVFKVQVGTSSQTVAYAYSNSGDPEPAQNANAALIAAAPELYEALSAAMKWLYDPQESIEQYERIGEEFYRETGYLRPGKDYPVGMPEPDDRCAVWGEWCLARANAILQNGRAALAKARGEAHE